MIQAIKDLYYKYTLWGLKAMVVYSITFPIKVNVYYRIFNHSFYLQLKELGKQCEEDMRDFLNQYPDD